MNKITATGRAWCFSISNSHRLCFCDQIMNVITAISKHSTINSSPPSVAYMYQWTRSALVQLVAFTCSAPSHYLTQWCLIVGILRKKFQWNSDQSTKLLIHKNASENIICEMAVILSWGDELKTSNDTWLVFAQERITFLQNKHFVLLLTWKTMHNAQQGQ